MIISNGPRPTQPTEIEPFLAWLRDLGSWLRHIVSHVSAQYRNLLMRNVRVFLTILIVQR